MMIDSRDAAPVVVNLSEATREGYAALKAGNIALLGRERRPGRQTPELITASIADILLTQESTAIMHFEDPGDEDYARSTMMAVNYHNGHSEGDNLVVVQHPQQPEAGQWMLYNYPDDYDGPGAENRVLYKRPTFLGDPHDFQPMPSNPEKIRNYLLHAGEADKAIVAFEALGYQFSDELLPEDLYDEFKAYRATQTIEWDFSDDGGGSIHW